MPSVIIFVVAIYAAMKNNFVISYPLSQFYPFGSIAADNNLPANDDGFTSSIPIYVPFPFFGSSYSSVYVSICTRMLERKEKKYQFAQKKRSQILFKKKREVLINYTFITLKKKTNL